MLRHFLVSATLVVGLAACQTVNRLPPERVAITTPTFISQYHLYRNDPTQPPTSVTADIHLPVGHEPGQRHPAIILYHGSGGVGAQTEWWTNTLTQRGLAVMVIDGFTGRGVANTNADQFAVTFEQSLTDAFMGLNILAEHPAILPDNIGVMGWSRGGIVALYSSMKRLRDNFAEGDNKFAYHVAMYPFCGYYPHDLTTTGSPIQIQVGRRDTLTPPERCDLLVEKFADQGVEVDYLSHSDAGHAFDDPRVVGMSISHVTLQNISKPQRCWYYQREDDWWVEGSTDTLLDSRDHITQIYHTDFCGPSRTEVLYKPSSSTTKRSRDAIFEMISRMSGLPSS